ncbi:uncharacterized protein HKW66_Vig0118250 [Vigna angularis]|uniref:C2H2-type domain-containing protein n=1 Tax=Phaseolus angularis TaxID=3914 RepID=A0A8T0JZM6_PHAAN|nr:uncharacterized protein HKW66_Vig0118250 [Vigna angularis]
MSTSSSAKPDRRDKEPYQHHICEECGKELPTKTGLKIHKHIHKKSDLPPNGFVCEYCAKAFDSKRQLSGHMLVHRT